MNSISMDLSLIGRKREKEREKERERERKDKTHLTTVFDTECFD